MTVAAKYAMSSSTSGSLLPAKMSADRVSHLGVLILRYLLDDLRRCANEIALLIIVLRLVSQGGFS